MSHNKTNLFFTVIAVIILNTACAKTIDINNLPSPGIYDGNIGNAKLILVIQNNNDEQLSGYYIYNRKNAVEEDHPLQIAFNDKIQLISDNYTGTFNGEISNETIEGKLHISKNKPSLFFWKNKKKVSFTKRSINNVTASDRYKRKIFDKIDIHKDQLYGKAKGYWTESPYLDEPYIEVLSKSAINLLKNENNLDLKLDIYEPANDHLEKRPLVMLVHGGGFYIGNKSSTTERIIAKELTSRGYVVASMDYRIGFKMTPTDIERSGYKAIQDVHAALRYLSHHAKAYRIDPKQVYVAGTSAGAIASLNIAFMDNNERPKSTYSKKRNDNLGNIESSGNHYKDKFEVKAVGNLWGAVTDTLIIDPKERIPVISFHGTKDNIVPYDHDYPFQNTFMINRFIMNKMYGSEPINERLDNLKIENRLVVFEGLGHEPHLDNFETPNSIFDIILKELITFFYEQTASKINLNTNLIIVNKNDKIKPLQLEIENCEINYIEVNGGLKVSSKPDENQIIWINGYYHPTVTIHTKNKFEAWNSAEISVKINP